MTSVGMIFAKEPPQQEIRNSAFMNVFLKLPAGVEQSSRRFGHRVQSGLHITALFPHTHLRGKSWEYRLVYPDGRLGSRAVGAEIRFQLADLLRLHEAAGGAERLAP